jgi:hypothetical protein
MKTPICSSDFNTETLKFFSMEQVNIWFSAISKIDRSTSEIISQNLAKIYENTNKLTPDLIAKLQNISSEYNWNNFEAYHGYTVYAFPDDKKIVQESGNYDIYYGLAKATSYGITHQHFESDAYNLVLEGEGIFIGNENEKDLFKNFYHKKFLLKGSEFEIPKGMTHGHLVKKGKPVWFLFVQVCGFKPGLNCEGDFHITENINIQEYGDDYL